MTRFLHPVFLNPLDAQLFDQRRDWMNLILADNQADAQRFINQFKTKPEPIWFCTQRLSYTDPVRLERDEALCKHLRIHTERFTPDESDDKGKWQLMYWCYCGLDRRIERPEEDKPRQILMGIKA